MTSQLKLAFSLQQQGKLQKAAKLYQRILKAEPKNFLALDGFGTLYGQQKNFEAALSCFTKAATIRPNDFAIYFNMGMALKALKRYKEALANFDKAITLKPDFAEAYNNQGDTLKELNQFDEALACINKAITLKPNCPNAFNYRGATFQKMQQFEKALSDYDQAIAINPRAAESYFNRALLLTEMRRYEQAIASYEQAIAIKPTLADAYYNRGNLLRDLKRYEEALSSYNNAIEINPNHHYAKADRLLAQMYIADWHHYNQRLKTLIQELKKDISIPPPFHMLAFPISADLLKKSASIFSAIKYPASQTPLWNGERYRHARIRIGYFSADFHNHATAYLMAGLFEMHDHKRFETFAFSFGPVTGDEMQTQLEKSFDHFLEVSNQNSKTIAELTREMEIDIAIDLKGYTQDCRPDIFALRPAPVQVNYLGFPGTMGAPYIDYIIADSVILPEEHFQMYSEKVVHLPHSYQANDANRQIATTTLTRQELDLPESGFVFCCFNNTFKITPDLFSCWMRLLTKVDGSVLWLLEGSNTISRNLRHEAQKHGVSSERLIFSKRIEPSKHLARHRQADLFLDSFYCNAHTTASDALWAGLPLLTCLGNTFASRVAASLLQAVGLPELITQSHEEYEAMALKLATHPDELAKIKQKLKHNRLIEPLFNTRLYTQHIESAYQQMWQCQQDGLAPAHIFVTD